jgi:hypothetical protein
MPHNVNSRYFNNAHATKSTNVVSILYQIAAENLKLHETQNRRRHRRRIYATSKMYNILTGAHVSPTHGKRIKFEAVELHTAFTLK